MLIRNGAITIGFFLIGIFVYERYVLGLLDIFTGNRKEAAEMARVILTIGENHESVGFVTFNIFVDIFLCTLVMFFLNYQPKDHFRGKNIYIFRGMVLIPVIYEVGNIVLKYLAVKQKVTIPLFVMPFLTTKSPLIMVLFVALAAYIKKRERLFIRHGKSYEDYQEFLKSNTNAFQFFSFVLNTIEPGITSYTDALWYCFAIITTIGFGDVTATTGIGRMLSVILGIYGIIVVALITSIIVNFYTEVKNDDEK